MRRCKLTLFLGATTVLLALCAVGAPALSQAGSAGGSIGKQGKSESGSEDSIRPPAAGKRQMRRPHSTNSNTLKRSSGVAGRWHWTARCQQSIYQGEFEIGQVSDGSFTGAFFTDVPGAISGGRINGSQISFIRSVLGFQQPWRGTFSGSQMSGSIGGMLGDVCTFTASR